MVDTRESWIIGDSGEGPLVLREPVAAAVCAEAQAAVTSIARAVRLHHPHAPGLPDQGGRGPDAMQGARRRVGEVARWSVPRPVTGV